MQKQGRSRDQTLISPPKTNAREERTPRCEDAPNGRPHFESSHVTSPESRKTCHATPATNDVNHVRVLGLIWMCNVTIRISSVSTIHSTAGYLEVEDSDAAATQAWRGRMHRGHPEHPRPTLGVPVVWGGSGCISDACAGDDIIFDSHM